MRDFTPKNTHVSFEREHFNRTMNCKQEQVS